MDIRLAQKIAWENKRAKGINEDNIPSEFYSLKGEVADALIAWRAGRREVSQELADIAIFLLRLAQMVGTDLEEAIEARLASNTAAGSGQLFHEVTVGGSVVVTGSAVAPGKLVRDKIPQIIRSKGEEPVIHTAGREEYEIRLRAKLREEVEEFLASDNDPEELADILEVLHALAGQAGTDQQQLETLRAAKAEQRGGFADRIVWSGNRPSTGPQAASTLASATESMGLQMRLHQRRPATAG